MGGAHRGTCGPQVAAEYRAAWAAWQSQLEALHAAFLEGRPLAPPHVKGLLNREERAKQRYDAARRALLGIADPEAVAPAVPLPPERPPDA